MTTLGGVRVRGEDRERWRAQATSEGMTLTEWVRRRLNGAPRRDPRLDPRAGDMMRDATGEALADETFAAVGVWRVWTVLEVVDGVVLVRWMDANGGSGAMRASRRVLGDGWTTLEAVYVVPDGAKSGPSMG